MKTIATLALSLFCLTAQAQSIGLHIGSKHSEPGYNNANAGLNLTLKNGFTTGFYENSDSRVHGKRLYSLYAGMYWETERITLGAVKLSAGATLGAVTGYRRANVLPLAMLHGNLHIEDYTVTVGVIPKTGVNAGVVHLMLRKEF